MNAMPATSSDAAILRTDGRIYRLVTRSIPGVGIAVFDKNMCLLTLEGLWVSPPALAVEGTPIGESLPDQGVVFLPFFSSALQGHAAEFDYPLGEKVFHFHVVPVRDEEEHIVAGMAVCRDVTRERAKEQQLRSAALTDQVTGLRNRAGLLAIAQGLSSWRHVAVLSIDLDGFKAVNDTHGHPVGDEVLKIVGDRIRACLRKEDRAARFGGDEFVALLSNVEDPEEAMVIAERIVAAIRAPIALEGLPPISVTASVGMALGTRGTSFQEVYQRADALLCDAKRTGKNGVRGAA